MIKRNTWILLVVLVLIVASYLVWKDRQAGSEAAETPTPAAEETSFLLTDQDGLLTSVRIEDDQANVLLLERDSVGLWNILLPTPGPADLALASAAETQLMSMSIITTLETLTEAGIIGLTTPAYTIQVGFDSGASHTIEVGEKTPTESGYYVRFDGGEVLIVSLSAIDPLVQMLSAPPYPPTATPAPATETPTPAPATETPETTADATATP